MTAFKPVIFGQHIPFPNAVPKRNKSSGLVEVARKISDVVAKYHAIVWKFDDWWGWYARAVLHSVGCVLLANGGC